jgi:outer membrane protein assembly factor BamA
VKLSSKFYFFRTNHIITASIVCLFLFLSSCRPYKTVPKDRKLLKKNKIQVVSNVKNPSNYEIQEQIRSKPNRKILGIYRFHLRAYNLGTSKRKPEKNKNKIRTFLRERVGEAPTLYDSTAAIKSAKNIEQLLFNKGYFNAKVTFTVDTGRWKRWARVNYIIDPGKYYSIKSHYVLSNEYVLDSITEAREKESLIQEGDQVDFNLLGKERTRLTYLLQNHGFYYFGREFIEFDLDTSNQEVAVETIIISPDNDKTHKRVKLDSIKVIFPHLDVYHFRDQSDIKVNGIIYQMFGYPLSTQVLQRAILLKQNQWYSKDITEKTYVKLSQINLFKSIDIIYKPSSKDSQNLVNAFIYLAPFKKQEYTIEPQGVLSYDIQTLAQTNQNRSFGIGNALTYTNRNLLGHAEQLNLSSLTSFQAQIGSGSNTILEQSFNAGLKLPGSRLLSRLDNNSKVINYSTQINLSYVFQRNPDYRRNILPANFSYLINKKNNHNWLLTPFEVNFNRSTINPTFFNNLTQEQQKFINILFARNLLLSSSISYFTNRVSRKKPNKRYFVRTNLLELGGNSLFALSSLLSGPQDTLGTYEVLGVPFSQYVRSNIDLRLNHDLDPKNTMVYRLNLGIALPYGNREFLPVDKRYFVGGANSLRGWNPRAMGPGQYPDTSNSTSLDRTAELLILGNIEYRFDVVSNKAEMALFFDAGNVWNIVEGNNPDEKFKFNTFLPSIALNTGIGLRLDFQFFMVRLDWGIRMHNPALKPSDRWVIKDWNQPKFITNQTLLNFGLDYPF